jgi:Nucleoside phosphorylase
MNVSKLCLLVAMPAEAKPLIQHFNLVQQDGYFGKLPPLAYTGHYRNIDILVVVNGQDPQHKVDLVGTQPATLAAQVAIDKFNPDLIINAGTAGAFAHNGSRIGDVYLSHQHFVFHDRRIPIPGWDTYGVGRYPSYDTTTLAKTLGYKQGIVTTGNSLDMPPVDEQTINQIGGEVKDMEAAALAWVASLHGVPFFSVKSITDLMDSEKTTQEEFLENLHAASEALKDACFTIIDYIAEGGLEH